MWPAQRNEEPSGIFPVAPIARGGKPSTLARFVGVAVVVGAIAFLAGLQLGDGRTPLVHNSVGPSPAASPGGPSASPSGTPAVDAAPAAAQSGTSAFVRTFRPQDVVARIEGGAACVTRAWSVPGFPDPRPSRTLVRVWMVFCPVAATRRAALTADLAFEMERVIPFGTMSSTTNSRGMTVSYYPYTQGLFAGAVTIAAESAGTGLEIAISLEEHHAG